MIRSWIFEFFPELGDTAHSPAPAAVSSYFASYLDLWARDEELGFEGIFFSEHHFGGAFGASPNLLIAALAMKTQKLRLGVMGIVTPYYPPWRIVEEIGMLDHITNGRLEIGTAVGIPPELAAVHMSMEEARARNDEAIQILDAALAGNPVSFRGEFYNIDNLRLLPRPRQHPKPPVWTTVVGRDSAIKAARRGSKICTGFNSTAEIKSVFDSYRAEAIDAGFEAGPDQLAIRRRIAIAETQGQATEFLAGVSDRLSRLIAKDPRANIQQIPDAPQKGASFSLGKDEFISGTPSQVAEQIISQCRETGAGHFLAVLHWGAPFDEVSRAHELFGSKVIPELKRC